MQDLQQYTVQVSLSINKEVFKIKNVTDRLKMIPNVTTTPTQKNSSSPSTNSVNIQKDLVIKFSLPLNQNPKDFYKTLYREIKKIPGVLIRSYGKLEKFLKK